MLKLSRLLMRNVTSNLRKAHVTRDSIGPAIWVIKLSACVLKSTQI